MNSCLSCFLLCQVFCLLLRNYGLLMSLETFSSVIVSLKGTFFSPFSLSPGNRACQAKNSTPELWHHLIVDHLNRGSQALLCCVVSWRACEMKILTY